MHPEQWDKEMSKLIANAIDGQEIDISIGETRLEVVVASSTSSHKAGLSNHDSIPRQGMLFLYETDRTSPFTRQDMAFEIDIRFFDRNGDLVNLNKSGEIADAGNAYRFVLETEPRDDLEGKLVIHS